MTSNVSFTPVLVIGTGPVGAVLALELARSQVRSIVVSAANPTPPHPKTYLVNSRSMELLRRFGFTAAIRRHGVDPDSSTDIMWTRELGEPPVLVWHHPSVNHIRRRYRLVNDGTAPVEPYQRVSAAFLERLAHDEIDREPLIDLRVEWEIGKVQPDPDGVTAVVVDRRRGGTDTIRARYVAACEGGTGGLRSDLGIAMDERAPRQRFRSVHFTSRDPALHRFGISYTTIAANDLTLVSHGDGDEWTLSMPAESSGHDPLHVLKAALGTTPAVSNGVGTAEWDGSLSVARAYRSGPVYLAGDSAHEFYPGCGYNENTGIADAVDLGWKLAGAINGWGGPHLLASYETERRPVALFSRELSADLVEVGHRFTRLVLAGASREQLAGVLEYDVHRIDDLGVQLGYRYDTSPVVCHEDDDPPTWQWRKITPSTWPGVRAPAVRLADGSQLFDKLGCGFTLVDLSPGGAGGSLVAAATKRQVPMTHVRVDDAAVRGCWERELVLVRPDHVVAWRGEEPPSDWGAVLDRVTGQANKA